MSYNSFMDIIINRYILVSINYMKIILSIFTFLIFNYNLIGQHQFGIKAGFGISQTKSIITNDMKYQCQIKPSGNIGLLYNFNFGKNSYVGINALFMRILGKENFEKSQTLQSFNGTNWVPVQINSKSDFYRKLNYLGFPLYYGMTFNKFSINIGLQPSIILNNTFDGQNTTQYTGGQNNTEVFYWKNSEIGHNKIDLGAKAELNYSLSKNLIMEGTYYFGANKINYNYESNKSRISQLTLGIKYLFINRIESKKE